MKMEFFLFCFLADTIVKKGLWKELPDMNQNFFFQKKIATVWVLGPCCQCLVYNTEDATLLIKSILLTTFAQHLGNYEFNIKIITFND